MERRLHRLPRYSVDGQISPPLNGHARKAFYVDCYWILMTTIPRRQSVERIPTPRHIEIGTVTLPTSNSYIGLNFPPFFPTSLSLFTRQTTTGIFINTTKCSEYAPNNFQNLNNSSVIRSLPISQLSWKSADNFWSCCADKHTKSDKHGSKHYPAKSNAGNNADSLSMPRQRNSNYLYHMHVSLREFVTNQRINWSLLYAYSSQALNK